MGLLRCLLSSPFRCIRWFRRYEKAKICCPLVDGLHGLTCKPRANAHRLLHRRSAENCIMKPKLPNPSMRQVGKIIILMYALCGCLLCAFAPWRWWNTRAEQAQAELNRQLSALDQVFSVPHHALPADVTQNTLLPTSVGDFQRSNVDQRYCGVNAKICVSSSYDASDNKNFVRIFIDSSVNAAGELRNGNASFLDCGDMSGEGKLRIEAKYPYFYSGCHVMFSPGEVILREVVWANDDLLIRVGGNYDAMIDFLNHYPY
jgi:hypothetical protein